MFPERHTSEWDVKKGYKKAISMYYGIKRIGG